MSRTDVTSDTVAGTPGAARRGRPALKTVWRHAKHGWPPRFPIVQFPNAPLLVAGGGLLVAAVTTGSVHDHARAGFYAGLSAWAWLELTAGVNWVRRLTGAAGIAFVVVRVGEALRG